MSKLHCGKEVIVDGCMGAMMGSGGKMWGGDGKGYECKGVMGECRFGGI